MITPIRGYTARVLHSVEYVKVTYVIYHHDGVVMYDIRDASIYGTMQVPFL